MYVNVTRLNPTERKNSGDPANDSGGATFLKIVRAIRRCRRQRTYVVIVVKRVSRKRGGKFEKFRRDVYASKYYWKATSNNIIRTRHTRTDGCLETRGVIYKIVFLTRRSGRVIDGPIDLNGSPLYFMFFSLTIATVFLVPHPRHCTWVPNYGTVRTTVVLYARRLFLRTRVISRV